MVARMLEVLAEGKIKGDLKKPLGVTLKDGSVAGPGAKVSEDVLLGGAKAYDTLMDEKPCRVKKVK
jgi:hypothetical protein